MQPSAKSARPAQRPKERFPCRLPSCTKTFSRPYDVPRHLISVHGVDIKDVPELADLPSRKPLYRPVTCPECGKRLSRQDSLPRHRAVLHPELLQFQVAPGPVLENSAPSGSGSGQRVPSKTEYGTADPISHSLPNHSETMHAPHPSTSAQTSHGGMGQWTPTLEDWKAIFLQWAAMQRGQQGQTIDATREA